MNVTQEYSKFLVATSCEDIPEKECDRFKVRLLDSIGVIAAGTHAPGVEGAINLLKGIGGAEEATVLFHGGRLPADKASFVNSLMMRSYDYEVCGNEFPDYTTGPAHISGSTVPCFIAASELTHASGKEAMAASILGDDLACRLAQGTGFDFDAGWDNTGTVNGLGCTAIAAKLLGLDEEQCRNAFGIDINMIGGSIDGVMDGTLAFKVPHGLSGMNGIFAARLAQTGYTGTLDGLAGRHGYFDLFGAENGDRGLLMRDLGKFFYSDGGIKPWPSCRFTHSPIQSSLKISKENSIDSRDIEKVVIHLHRVAKLVDKPFEPVSPVPMFNVRFMVAVALTQGAVTPKYHQGQYQLDPEINRIANLIEVVYEPQQEHTLSSDVDIILADGTKYSNHIYQPKGDFAVDPLTREERLNKFYTNMELSGLISQSRAEEVVDAIDCFEDIADVNDFTALLV